MFALDLRGTALDGLTFPVSEVRRSAHDWFTARTVAGRFEVSCGPLDLGEAIHQLRAGASEPRRGRA